MFKRLKEEYENCDFYYVFLAQEIQQRGIPSGRLNFKDDTLTSIVASFLNKVENLLSSKDQIHLSNDVST